MCNSSYGFVYCTFYDCASHFFLSKGWGHKLFEFAYVLQIFHIKGDPNMGSGFIFFKVCAYLLYTDIDIIVNLGPVVQSIISLTKIVSQGFVKSSSRQTIKSANIVC